MRPAAQRGEHKQAIGISRGGRSTKIHAIVDSKGRPLNFTVTGGEVHDSQVVDDMLETSRPPLAVTADKGYDSEKVRQQIKDEGPCRSSRAAAMPSRKPIVPSASTADATKSKTTSAVSRIGGASPPATTNSPGTSLPPQPSSVLSIGSSCESRP